jgi:hypothetical protein
MKVAPIGAALALAGCVGDGVELGGVGKPFTAPTNPVACNEDSARLVSRALPHYPRDAVLFYIALQRDTASDVFPFAYDIRETGEVVNIRFTGPSEFTRHEMRQKMIRAAADALGKWKYEWIETPAYATGCEFTFEYALTSD